MLQRLSRISSGFFRLVFKGVFYKILVKIYFNVFRLKKNDLALKATKELIRNQLVYIFIVSFSAMLIFGNLTQTTQAVPISQQISRTVMANLTASEFSDAPTEVLIVETAGSGNHPTLPEKYSDDSGTLDKNSNLPTANEDGQDDLAIFNDEQDMVFKPQLTPGQNNAGDGAPVQRTEIVYYTIQNGDTVSAIARRFGISVNTILWSNNLTAYSLLRPGNNLAILPYSGVMYTVRSGDTVSRIAKQYGISDDKILSANNLTDGLKAGQKIILPGAQKLATAVARSSSVSGLSVISNLIKQPGATAGTGKMVWPTVGHRITQYFSWRHNGVDIGNKVGTPIYAADGGVVIISKGGWNGGYGNTIVIDHGGGKKTRYGHASKLFVKVGDRVEKGENIAAMGSTGRSTGPHLHFEVLVNGGRTNPLNYIR